MLKVVPAILGAYFMMSANLSAGAVTYLSTNRIVGAVSPSGTTQDQTTAIGEWVAFVNSGAGTSADVSAYQDSEIGVGGIRLSGSGASGNVFTTGYSSLFARVRLTAQTLITFSGSFVRFGVPGGSEISASIVGGDYNFSFAALDDQSPNGSFGATDVLLQPGDYDINLLSRSINFEVPALTFNLTFTTVPAPGAAGLALAGLGAAGLRRSRRED